MENQPSIKIYISKTGAFRARIKKANDTYPYHVTIGGMMWNEGKGREYEDIIMKKCQLLLNKINQSFENLSGH